MPIPYPLTRAEQSAYTETSLSGDVAAFIDDLLKQNDPRLRVTSFGETPEGRTLPLMLLSAGRHFTPEEAQRSGLPVVLILNGIHAGEVEGKEASLMLARDILAGLHGDWLEKMVLLIVPLFNADGNDRLSADNRPLDVAHFTGQLGPELVGTRGNAAGVNLNRDYMRQEALEMQLLQRRVCQQWNPHLSIDCHATNGSIHRFALSYDIPHTVESGRREPIDYMRERLLPVVSAAVKKTEGLDTFWYGNFLRDEGGEGTGWITYTHHPRFGSNYRGLGNRLDLLLETYSYLSFQERVHTTYAFLRETLNYAAAHGGEIVELLAACIEPPPQVAVRYRLEVVPDATVEILTRDPYTLQGAPIAVKVSYIGRFVGEHVVPRPLAYAIPAEIAARLEGHGLRIETPDQDLLLEAEIATVKGLVSSTGREILEANSTAWLEASYEVQHRPLPAGWCLVYTAQQRGAVAVYLCEAGSDDGLLACGWIEQPAPGTEFPAWRVLSVHAAGGIAQV